jgi:hypothetical protein
MHWPVGDKISVYLLSTSKTCSRKAVNGVKAYKNSTATGQDGSFDIPLMSASAGKKYKLCVVDQTSTTDLSKDVVIQYPAQAFINFTLLSAGLAALAFVLYVATARSRRPRAYD